jgi:hypothetical protein
MAWYLFKHRDLNFLFYIIIKATGLSIEVLGFDSLLGLGIFLFTTASRTAMGPTQPPIQWVPAALSWGKTAGA